MSHQSCQQAGTTSSANSIPTAAIILQEFRVDERDYEESGSEDKIYSLLPYSKIVLSPPLVV